jgi:hypothetical protein
VGAAPSLDDLFGAGGGGEGSEVGGELVGDERARKEGAAAQKQYVQVRVGCVCVCVCAAALQFSREGSMRWVEEWGI